MDWCLAHRAPDTYEWYRYRLERFIKRYPNLTVRKLKPFHVQQWLDDMKLSNGSKRNYCRSIKRCTRWAKQQGYIEHNPLADMPEPRCGKREPVLYDTEFANLLTFVRDESFRDLLVVSWGNRLPPTGVFAG